MALVCLMGSVVSAFAPPCSAADFVPSEERPARLGYEALGGALGASAGALGGGLGSFALISGDSHAREGGFGYGLVLLGGIGIGAFFGQSAGVTLAGGFSGANGSYWGSLGGETLGLAVGVGAMLLLPKIESRTVRTALWTVALTALPVAGSILGYELTTSTRRDPTTTVSLAPFAPPTRASMLGWSQAF